MPTAGLLKNVHLRCCAANRTAQRISIHIRLAALFFARLASEEQPQNRGLFKNTTVGYLSAGWAVRVISWVMATAFCGVR